MVMDIEATCEEPNPVDYFHEIIELPMVIVDIETREIVSIYSVMKKLFLCNCVIFSNRWPIFVNM